MVLDPKSQKTSSDYISDLYNPTVELRIIRKDASNLTTMEMRSPKR